MEALMFDRVLLCADASDNALRAVDYVIGLRERLGTPIDIHLLNVQRPVSGDVSTFVGKGALRQYHHDNGLKALERARARLDASGLPYTFHLLVGDPAQMISQYAREKGCDHIVLGRRGLGSFTGGLLGSVAHKVLHTAEPPVVLVK
jgi:nucleotide-binding universal stress UspA family protein